MAPAALAADQQRARADYPRRATLKPGLTISALLKTLDRLISGERVRIRDLADHRPINYLPPEIRK
jgi:hypothetical protein